RLGPLRQPKRADQRFCRAGDPRRRRTGEQRLLDPACPGFAATARRACAGGNTTCRLDVANPPGRLRRARPRGAAIACFNTKFRRDKPGGSIPQFFLQGFATSAHILFYAAGVDAPFPTEIELKLPAADGSDRMSCPDEKTLQQLVLGQLAADVAEVLAR